MKKSKAATYKEKQMKQLMETLASLLFHPRMIKFWAIHYLTMEAYTLWWNGESMEKFWKTNSRISEAMENQYVLIESHMTMLELEKILAFLSKCAKLTLSLIMIMDRVHKDKIIHNDIFLSKVLFYFPPDYIYRIYIGICD